MELIWLIPVAGLAAVFYAGFLTWDVLRRDTGTPEMEDVASMIFEGAMAFLRRQYGTIALLAVVTAVVIAIVVGAVSDGVKEIIADAGSITYGKNEVSQWEEGLLTGIAFIVGAACSALAGYIGMYISVRSNSRTASAATRSLREAITVSLRGGAVSGFLVVALSLLGVSSIYFIYTNVLGTSEALTPFLIVGYGFGASFVALFAQLGGGIYTKAADVGADLVGKIEAGIPEDDPRNAAVVADLVGDNVGDCAGRGADLFESMSAENIGAMILGVAIYKVTGDLQWVVFPLVLRSFGIFATIAGLPSVPLFALGSRADIPGVGGFTTGVFGTAVATMGMLMSAAYILSMDTFGPITDNAGGITEMAGAPESARHITDSLDSVGNTTKALTKGYAVASAGLAAFLLFSAFLDKVKERLAVPLNQELPIDLSSVDVFAGGLIGAMLVFLFSSLAIRAVSSAAQDIIQEVRRQFREDPGIMAGTSRPDYGRAVDITARAALRNMIAPGILAVGTPIAVGLIFRYVRAADYNGLQDASGWLAVSGLLMIGTITGILLATFFNNVGGAWDNAKKYIEAGNLKTESAKPGAVEVLGKGTEAHRAAVVGDTVGDPCKDTAGPSLHVLIKLLSTITLVMAPLFIP